MSPRRTFADLLNYLNENLPDNTISRIRYVTSHPRYFSDRVIDAVADLDKVCECFHMPFQAGSDSVLKGMRRGYTYSSYMTIINKIRAKAPDASICGDVIVGFPGKSALVLYYHVNSCVQFKASVILLLRLTYICLSLAAFANHIY